MAVLRFSFGTMGSGKSTLALQIHHNLSAAGLRGLLLSQLDRDGAMVSSRLGVSSPAVEVRSDLDLKELAKAHRPLDYMVCDEAQFYTPDQCDQLARVVD
ncbi:MAG TPA: thymidine kinase, partial [Acidimicrobiales bacterium]